jgi:enoyl-CoA hydratase/carnithine racemase
MGAKCESDEHVAIVTIDRADRANAIDLETAQQLSEIFDGLEQDERVRAVVLTGAGERIFCAGMDLQAVEAGQAAAINNVPGGFAGIARRDFQKPLIAAVNGAALGGGFEIALACDLVVAAANARFGLPEVSLGLFAASGGAVRIALRLPSALALEHLLIGDPIGAQRALELGLANRVVTEGTAREEALGLAHRISRNAPLAVQASKRIARVAMTAGEEPAWVLNAQLADRVTASEDAREGGAAARERRVPVWTGR